MSCIPYSRKYSRVEIFSEIPPDTPGEIFPVFIFETVQPMRKLRMLIEESAPFKFMCLYFCNTRQPRNFAPCENFPLYGIWMGICIRWMVLCVCVLTYEVDGYQMGSYMRMQDG